MLEALSQGLPVISHSRLVIPERLRSVVVSVDIYDWKAVLDCINRLREEGRCAEAVDVVSEYKRSAEESIFTEYRKVYLQFGIRTQL
jgi:hypothetical protein